MRQCMIFLKRVTKHVTFQFQHLSLCTKQVKYYIISLSNIKQRSNSYLYLHLHKHLVYIALINPKRIQMKELSFERHIRNQCAAFLMLIRVLKLIFEKTSSFERTFKERHIEPTSLKVLLTNQKSLFYKINQTDSNITFRHQNFLFGFSKNNAKQVLHMAHDQCNTHYCWRCSALHSHFTFHIYNNSHYCI